MSVVSVGWCHWCRRLLATVTAQVLEAARVLLLGTAWALSQVLVWARARVLLLAGGSYPHTCHKKHGGPLSAKCGCKAHSASRTIHGRF